MNVFCKKEKQKITQHRGFKNFDNHVFQREFNGKLLKID